MNITVYANVSFSVVGSMNNTDFVDKTERAQYCLILIANSIISATQMHIQTIYILWQQILKRTICCLQVNLESMEMLHPVSGLLRRTRHGGLDVEVKVARDLKEFEGHIKSGYIQVRMCVCTYVCTITHV